MHPGHEIKKELLQLTVNNNNNMLARRCSNLQRCIVLIFKNELLNIIDKFCFCARQHTVYAKRA